MTDIVIEFYNRQTEVLDFLMKSNEISMAQDFQVLFQKNLPLAAASYFEAAISKILSDMVSKKTNGCPLTINFLQRKAIKQQYHTLFEWDKNNINKFLSFFGEEFKKEVNDDFKADNALDQAAKDFLAIGNIRNCIVHQNYAVYVSGTTSEEIYQKFISAKKLVNYIEGKLVNG